MDLFKPDLRREEFEKENLLITNNVTRLLESNKIPFTAYEIPEEKLGALETANILHLPSSLIYKTIVVVRPKGKPFLCVIPGDHTVDLKAVAALTNEKKVNVPTQAEAEFLTKLQAGGISPLALINKGFIVYLDTTSLNQEHIYVSGGQRGLIIRLHPTDLVKLTGAKYGLVSKPE